MNLCAYVLQNLTFSVFPRKPSRYQNVKLMNLTWRYYMRICGKSSCNWRQFQHHSTLITSYIEHCFEIKSTFKGTTLDTQLCRHLIYNQLELNIQPFSKNLNFELEIVNTFEYLFCLSKYWVPWYFPETSHNFSKIYYYYWLPP